MRACALWTCVGITLEIAAHGCASAACSHTECTRPPFSRPAGDTTKATDPYFPFEDAVGVARRHAARMLAADACDYLHRCRRHEHACICDAHRLLQVDVWGRTFAALGINYMGSQMTLDLCDRCACCSATPAAVRVACICACVIKCECAFCFCIVPCRQGKYSNGFCHWTLVRAATPQLPCLPAPTAVDAQPHCAALCCARLHRSPRGATLTAAGSQPLPTSHPWRHPTRCSCAPATRILSALLPSPTCMHRRLLSARNANA